MFLYRIQIFIGHAHGSIARGGIFNFNGRGMITICVNVVDRRNKKHHFSGTLNTTSTVATWNVRTLYQTGNFENKKSDVITFEKGKFIYSQDDSYKREVGILLNNKMSKHLEDFWAVSDRVLLVKIHAKPFNLAVIQVYAPKSESSEKDLDAFYSDLDDD
ncbi:hypothetical protein HELRODRAFT_165137 [Helobdella robusta]|uniref:Uncharacterized protein n=1 Tax=Helobdella robusta TaxID=6412 RepID=T1EWB9_HELRO|nr:hypothetical protein HELRODRAFT_165137 [Helobdella robusta]ESN92988.1 hypothetical protein HELRODRAFT_165137 [Helobdella robusta]